MDTFLNDNSTTYGQSKILLDSKNNTLSEQQKNSNTDINATSYKEHSLNSLATIKEIQADMTTISITDYNYKIAFSIPIIFSYLHSTKLSFSLPKISLKKKYRRTMRISYGQNFAHHIAGKCSIYIDKTLVKTLTPLSRDFERALLTDKELYDECIHNTNDYLLRTKDKSAETINLPETFYNTFEEVLVEGFPLFKIKNSSLTFIYEYVLDIRKYLKLEIRENEQWKLIEIKNEYFENPVITNIDLPILYARCNIITDKQIYYHNLCLTKDNEPRSDKEEYVYITDYVITKEKSNDKEDVSVLINNDFTCYIVMWLIQSQREIHNLSSYHEIDEYGDYYNPCLKCSLTIDGINVFSITGKTSDCYNFFDAKIKKPKEFGYNIHVHGSDPKLLYNKTDNGEIYKNAKMNISILEKNNINSNESDTDIKYVEKKSKKLQNEYDIYVICKVFKTLKFTKKENIFVEAKLL